MKINQYNHYTTQSFTLMSPWNQTTGTISFNPSPPTVSLLCFELYCRTKRIQSISSGHTFNFLLWYVLWDSFTILKWHQLSASIVLKHLCCSSCCTGHPWYKIIKQSRGRYFFYRINLCSFRCLVIGAVIAPPSGSRRKCVTYSRLSNTLIFTL